MKIVQPELIEVTWPDERIYVPRYAAPDQMEDVQCTSTMHFSIAIKWNGIWKESSTCHKISMKYLYLRLPYLLSPVTLIKWSIFMRFT